MTKEELYEENEKARLNHGFDFSEDLDEFFKDKVIIQRGDTIQAQFMDGWADVFTMSENREYRIKPKEPIYEWQWKYEVDDYVLKTENYYTDYEARIDFTKIEETKRERKQ